MGFDEEVRVAGYEDESVEELGKEGDAFGAPVTVDGEDEDAFCCYVRQVGRYSEDVPSHLEPLSTPDGVCRCKRRYRNVESFEFGGDRSYDCITSKVPLARDTLETNNRWGCVGGFDERW